MATSSVEASQASETEYGETEVALRFVGAEGGVWSRLLPPAAPPERASASRSANDAAASAVYLLAADTALPWSAALPGHLDPRLGETGHWSGFSSAAPRTNIPCRQ